MAAFTKVAMKTDIPEGTGKAIEVGGKTIALFHCGGEFYAIDNTCAHRGGPLAEGGVSGTSVTCPWHGWEYDVRSGECAMDSSVHVQRFDVKVDGENILVAL